MSDVAENIYNEIKREYPEDWDFAPSLYSRTTRLNSSAGTTNASESKPAATLASWYRM